MTVRYQKTSPSCGGTTNAPRDWESGARTARTNPNYELLPSGQAEAYRLLMSLGEGQHAEEAIIQQLGLKSCLPLWSRIEHLEERGMIRSRAVVKA